MKNRVWVVSPFVYLATAIMVAMTAVGWFWMPRYLFWAEVIATAVMVVLSVVFSIQFRVHIRAALMGAGQISGNELENLDEFQVPVLVTGSREDIVWANKAFLHSMEGENFLGMHISTVLGATDMEEIITDGGDIVLGEREFSVFGRHTDSGAILYFIEDTYYKEVEREYNNSRPVVMLAAFDNEDEIMRDSNSGEETRILGQVESTLNDWAYSSGGIYKKLSGGSRYLMVTDERHFQQEKENRFPLLDRIRQIKTTEGRNATLSVGVGQQADSFAEAEKWARQSLDMALGRGGDQVAIKQESDSYEFFGGLSKGMEKRDKSRTRVIAGAISDLIKASDLVLVMGHKYSDLDSVGSCIGMWSAAHRGMKKPAYVVIDKNRTLASPLIDAVEKNLSSEDSMVFLSPAQALEIMTPKTLLIVTDTHAQDYVESADVLDHAGRVVVIDHHRMVVRHIENADVFFHETFASSASEMVAELVQFMGDHTLNRVEAEALLSGIMLDTKGFVVRCGVRTFEAAAYLRRRGADTVETKRMFSGSIENYKAKFQLVSNAEIYGTCAIACASGKSIPDIRIVASQAADELLAIQGVLASFVLYDYGENISLSARSMGDVNVQLLMEEMGGGGHLTMAGAQLTNMNLDDAKMKLLAVLEKSLSKATKSD